MSKIPQEFQDKIRQKLVQYVPAEVEGFWECKDSIVYYVETRNAPLDSHWVSFDLNTCTIDWGYWTIMSDCRVFSLTNYIDSFLGQQEDLQIQRTCWNPTYHDLMHL